MPALHHPVFQSLVLPALLAWAGIALLRALPGAAGARWAPLGAVLALLAALAVQPGFGWPATAAAQKLPWVVLAGLVLAALLRAREAGRARAGSSDQWLAAVLCWAGASVWLAGGRPALLPAALTALAGAVVLALLAWGGRPMPRRPPGPAGAGMAPRAAAGDGAPAAAALTMATLGLSALAVGGGSLLLAQLALALATVSAVLGLWVWLRPDGGLTVPAAVLMPLGLAWLAIATTLPPLAGVGMVHVAGLALGFGAPPLVLRSGLLAHRPRWAPLAVALLAAVPVALAVGWQIAAGGMPAGAPGIVDDDPYYEPQRP